MILAATSLMLTSTLTADYVIVLLWNFVLFLLDTITNVACIMNCALTEGFGVIHYEAKNEEI